MPFMAASEATSAVSRAATRSVALRHSALAQPEDDRWIIEGAGGVLVPVNASQLMVDLIVRLGLPALVVARSVTVRSGNAMSFSVISASATSVP